MNPQVGLAIYPDTHITAFLLDVDECSLNNGNCQQSCHNSVGSYRCTCASGYTLMADGRSCAGNIRIEFLFSLVYGRYRVQVVSALNQAVWV